MNGDRKNNKNVLMLLFFSFLTLYVSTFLLIYNLLHVKMNNNIISNLIAVIFVFVQIIWYLIILNHVTTMSRLAFFKNLEPIYVKYEDLPSFSIIIPIYEEPKLVLEELVDGIMNLIYPKEKFEVIVVDDSNVKTLIDYNYGIFRKLREMGIWLKYDWRIGRKGFRGGAVKEGIQLASKEYIVTLDADHAPLPYVLLELASIVKNPKYDYDVIIFPQFFKNWNKNSITIASYIGYRFDYAFSRKGKAVTNSAFCVGTNWVARRKKIIEAGIYYEQSIVEDMATSMILWHPNGLKIGFYDRELAYGMVPETLNAFKKQQYRWARGAFELLPDYFKVFRKLTNIQKFDYLSQIIWYFIGLTVILSNIFPISTALGFMFIDIKDIFVVIFYTLFQVFLYPVPLYLVGEPLGRVFKGESIGIIVSGIYAKALIDTILRKKAVFVVTPKGREVTSLIRILEEVKVPLILFSINILAIILALRNITWENTVTIFWALYNISWLSSALWSLTKDILEGKI